MTETVNMPQLAAHDRCTGCGACSSGCPKGAIRMAPDREGFLYPEVTDGCVQCGHCAHVCPVQKQREHRTAPQVFAVWSRDESVRQASTCGGAFSALAEYVLEGGGVVFGAALDENLRVVHTAVKNVHDLSRLRGMKPVQSDTGDAYQQVRLYLDQGRQVLFSGTPCQVDGLYRYLGEHPERLLTCDVACGGVCSPGVWAQLVKSMAYVKQHRPTAVEFCGKLTGDRERRFRVKFEGGGRYDAPMGKCELGRGIARRLFMRPACHRCAYATTDRPGDVTLGDFSGGSFAVSGSNPYNERAKEVCAYEKYEDHRRFSAAGTFSFGLCKYGSLRGVCTVFAGNGYGRACTKHRAAGEHSSFCFGKYRDSHREHGRTQNGESAAGGYNTSERGNAADRQQPHGNDTTESIRTRTAGRTYGNTAAGA